MNGWNKMNTENEHSIQVHSNNYSSNYKLTSQEILLGIPQILRLNTDIILGSPLRRTYTLPMLPKRLILVLALTDLESLRDLATHSIHSIRMIVIHVPVKTFKINYKYEQWSQWIASRSIWFSALTKIVFHL